MKYGTYVSYDSIVHGKGKGQVIDVIEKEGRSTVIIEPTYSKDDKRKEDVLISVDLEEANEIDNASTKNKTVQRMVYR